MEWRRSPSPDAFGRGHHWTPAIAVDPSALRESARLIGATQPASCGGDLSEGRSRRLCAVRLPVPEQKVRHPAGAGHGVEVEAVEQLVVGVPEAFALAELDRRYGDVHRVDEVGVEELADGRDTATEAHVLAVCGVLRLPQGVGGYGVNEVEAGVGQGERRALVVSEHEHRRAERRGA